MFLRIGEFGPRYRWNHFSSHHCFLNLLLHNGDLKQLMQKNVFENILKKEEITGIQYFFFLLLSLYQQYMKGNNHLLSSICYLQMLSVWMGVDISSPGKGLMFSVTPNHCQNVYVFEV